MIVRCRRLFHSTWNRTFKTLRRPSSQSLEICQLHLCQEIVDSTLSNCPSDTIALGFFLWCARQPNYFHGPRSFDLMIPVLLRLTERFGSVSGIVDELESIGCSRKAQTFILLLRIYWRGSMYRMALEAFNEMGSQDFVPNTFARNIVVDVLFKIGHFDAAMRFFRDTQFPNFLSFNIVLRNLCKSSDWSGAREILREMVKRGFRPNTGTYLMALDCFRMEGRTAELLQLLGFMIISGERPSVTIWTILIDCLCRAGQIDIASRLLGKMVDTGCSPNVVTYTSIIRGFFEAQMHTKVFWVLDAMLSSRCAPDLILCNVLIDSLSKAGRYDEAFDIFLGFHGRKIKPDSYTLSSLAPVLCLSRKMNLLPKLFAGVDVCVDLVACNTLLNVLCKAGFPSQAVEFFRDMIDAGFTPDSYSFVALLSGICKLGKIDYAVNVYHAIVVNNPHIDAYVHTTILDGLVKGGKYHKAVRLFREAVSENYCLDVVSYTIALHGLFRGGWFEDACNLFNQMKEIGVVPNICTYNVMLCGLCEARDINAVKQLLKDMRIAGVELNCISFNTIIGLMFKLHRVRSAALLFMKMCDLVMKPSRATCLRLLMGLASGEVDDLFPRLTYYLEDTTSVVSDGSDIPDDLPLCSAK